MLAKNSKNIILAAAAAVIGVGLLGGAVYNSQKGGGETPQPVETPKPSPVITVKTSVPVGTKTSAADYTKLVKEYEGYRFQFDALCQAIPKSATFKNGTKILLDNRSGDARYVSVGGVSYYLGGLGYKVITLYSSELPKTLFINCGAAVNVGQILLQN